MDEQLFYTIHIFPAMYTKGIILFLIGLIYCNKIIIQNTDGIPSGIRRAL
jgi:hypothetical protein